MNFPPLLRLTASYVFYSLVFGLSFSLTRAPVRRVNLTVG
jgi:hypothetical protein